jgi:predicted esterase YcpF (UPF0227 family)
MILYLHGFRSSPHSFKARMLAERLHALGRGHEYLCPQLPPSPAAAIALAQSLIAAQPPEQLTLIGSSLGGYYATWLAEQTGCRAVLLNPAVAPPQDLAKHVGISTDWHSGAPFEFKAEYIDELHALAVPRISRPERYFLVAATGDEVLDWRDMVAHYAAARQLIVQGSDHGLSDFASQIDAVLAFCDAPRETPA